MRPSFLSTSPLGTFVGLYSGAGGMDLGFVQAGFVPVWTNELDRYASATHEAALRHLTATTPHMTGAAWVHHTGDLLALADDDLPAQGAATLVIGGPPCQGFSVAGRMDPDDTRSEHVHRFMDIVERVQPEAFVMENVKALAVNSRWETVRADLDGSAVALGYRAERFVCNAADYGVPQARERMFFIGFRDDLGITPTAPPVTLTARRTVRDTFAALPRYGAPGNTQACTARITPAVQPVLRRSPWAGMLFNGSGRPMDLEAPALTLPASMGGNRTPIVDQYALDTGAVSWVEEYHRHLQAGGPVAATVPECLRRITVEEAAALQTFPAWMPWQGPTSARFRQVGNAVPPLLAFAVARSVADQIRQCRRSRPSPDRGIAA